MAHLPQVKIPATYMRGGTSKGVFFRLEDLPAAAQLPGKARDAAKLAKNDLQSRMVGEFPELQGIMGGYYARLAGQPDAVADAGARAAPMTPSRMIRPTPS